ncbi:hypothetical protein [Paenibacillus durus]|uniref:DUF3899 domain-containing protein n=1 Tax=Paenibacillus durus TaxID=44251 RepID=A0A089HK23_PAEDU|nr:hypothetical protein [Paenibacillus durus]AIQ11422.1 hypothetical protein PDUR_05125 [Paenibacillus durus]
MIIWKGWGILVLPIVVAAIFLSNFALGLFVSVDSLAENAILGLGLVLSAVPIWFIGKLLNNRSQRVMIDKETGQEFMVGNVHSFFFIRMEYCSFVAAVFGILFLFAT